MEGRELAGSGLVPDQALCGYHSFPSIIKSVLLHKQKAWNEKQSSARERASAENVNISFVPEQRKGPEKLKKM